jgi:hypothetical protein
MQQPKNEPNANPIRTLKKSRVISTGKLSKIRLNRRPQRDFTEGHRDHERRIQGSKLQIVAPQQFEINLASLLVTLLFFREDVSLCPCSTVSGPEFAPRNGRGDCPATSQVATALCGGARLLASMILSSPIPVCGVVGIRRRLNATVRHVQATDYVG